MAGVYFQKWWYAVGPGFLQCKNVKMQKHRFPLHVLLFRRLMEHADVVYKMFQVNWVLQVTFLAVTNSDHFHNYPLDHFSVDGVPDKPSLKQY